MEKLILALGRSARETANNLLYALGFFFLLIRGTRDFIREKQVGFKVLIMQVYFTGVQALGTIALLSLAIGAVIIIQGVSLLPQLGQGDLIYSILITIITRELGPLLTAFILTARSGVAITTELGNMVVNHEIEAYFAVGINPISYLVVPRFLGVTIAIFILNLYFNIFGLLGSFMVAQFIQPIAVGKYLHGLLAILSFKDIISSFVKSLTFGIIISSVSTHQGFKVTGASTEVPVAAIRSVAWSFALCIVADAVITLVYYV